MRQTFVDPRSGGRLIYERWGSGRAVVLVHGLAGSARWWRRNVPALAARYRVYAVELMGFGANRARPPLPLRGAADLLAAWVATLPGARAHVIGHSMGGQVATHLAAAHPAQVDRLVLVAASGLERASVWHMALRLPGVSRRIAPGFHPTLLADATRAGPRTLVRAAQALLDDDVTPLLAQIAAPTLIIAGEHDTLIPPALSEQTHVLLPGSRYVLLRGAGHVVMWDQAAAFNRAVLRFLAADAPDHDQNSPVDK